MPFTSLPYTAMMPAEPYEDVPQEARTFLARRGWINSGVDPRNNALLYQHSRYGQDYFRWSEAVAMEMIGLMQVGHDNV